MMKNPVREAEKSIADLISAAFVSAAESGDIPFTPEPVGIIEFHKDRSKGDFSSAHAMAASGILQMKPEAIASLLIKKMDLNGSCFESAEAAGPGYINFYLSGLWYENILKKIAEEGCGFGRLYDEPYENILLKFFADDSLAENSFEKAKANVFRDALVSVLEFAGYNVETEAHPGHNAGLSDLLSGCDMGSFDKVLALYPSDLLRDTEKIADSADTKDIKIIFYNDNVVFHRSTEGQCLSQSISGSGCSQISPYDFRTDAVRFSLNSNPMSSAVFDPDFALRKDFGSPLYYIQYVCSRICRLSDNFAAEGVHLPKADEAHLSLLCEPEEIYLIKRLAFFPEMIRLSAEKNDPSSINGYLTELASGFYNFYFLGGLKKGKKDILEARLFLADCTRIVLENALALIGVNAPKKR